MSESLRSRVLAAVQDAPTPVTIATVRRAVGCSHKVAARHLLRLHEHGSVVRGTLNHASNGTLTYSTPDNAPRVAHLPARLPDETRYHLHQALEKHPDLAAYLAGRDAHDLAGSGWITPTRSDHESA